MTLRASQGGLNENLNRRDSRRLLGGLWRGLEVPLIQQYQTSGVVPECLYIEIALEDVCYRFFTGKPRRDSFFTPKVSERNCDFVLHGGFATWVTNPEPEHVAAICHGEISRQLR